MLRPSLPPLSMPQTWSRDPGARLNQAHAVRYAISVSRSLTPSLGTNINATMMAPMLRVAHSCMDAGLHLGCFRGWNISTVAGTVRVWNAPGRQPEGPAYVFLHGLGGCAADMGEMLSKLRRTGRRVTAIDLPNHGDSCNLGLQAKLTTTAPINVCLERLVQAVNTALDTVVDEPVVLIGHSLGGYLAARYQLEGVNRACVSKLILVSPDGAPYSGPELVDGRRLMNVRCHADASRLAQLTFPGRPWRAALYTPFIWARFSSARLRYLVHSDAYQPVLSPQQLKGLPPRTLLIYGLREALDPPHNLTYFNTYLPHTYQLAQPDTGHGDLCVADPRLIALIEAFSVR